MGLLRPRVRDDRGGRVSVPLRIALSRAQRGAWHERGIDYSWKEAAVQILMMGAPVVAMIMVAQPLHDAVGRPAAFILMIAMWAVPSVASLPLIAAVRVRRVVARRLSEKRCPACDYSLARIAAEADGCTVCPECGAAWKLGEGTGEKEQSAGEKWQMAKWQMANPEARIGRIRMCHLALCHLPFAPKGQRDPGTEGQSG